MQYDEQVAKHVTTWASRLQVRVKSQLFEPMDQTPITELLYAFKLAFDYNSSRKSHQVVGLLFYQESSNRSFYQTPLFEGLVFAC